MHHGLAAAACIAPSLLLATAPALAAPVLQELRWLVTTAWNRGAVHARFGRTGEAEQYQRWAAGALQYHAPLEAQYQVPGGAASVVGTALPIASAIPLLFHCSPCGCTCAGRK